MGSKPGLEAATFEAEEVTVPDISIEEKEVDMKEKMARGILESGRSCNSKDAFEVEGLEFMQVVACKV